MEVYKHTDGLSTLNYCLSTTNILLEAEFESILLNDVMSLLFKGVIQ